MNAVNDSGMAEDCDHVNTYIVTNGNLNVMNASKDSNVLASYKYIKITTEMKYDGCGEGFNSRCNLRQHKYTHGN